jgi:hypothetical protein
MEILRYCENRILQVHIAQGLDYWEVMFSIKFNEDNTTLNKALLEAFYLNIQDQINNGDNWSLTAHDTYLSYKHYASEREKKFILRMQSDEPLIDLYYICYHSRYIVYSNYNGEVNFVTDLTAPCYGDTNDTNDKNDTGDTNASSAYITSSPDRVWCLNDRIIVEYSHIPKIKDSYLVCFNLMRQYFYFIYHTKTDILEIYNGCHWVFKLEKKLDNKLETFSSMIREDATSTLNHQFDVNDEVIPLLASDGILGCYPGELLYFASKDRMFAQKDNEVLVDVIFDRLLPGEDIYKPGECNYIRELGYSMDPYYKYIACLPCDGKPAISYRFSDSDDTRSNISSFGEHVEVDTKGSTTHIRYPDYSCEVITKSLGLGCGRKYILKHNGKCILSATSYYYICDTSPSIDYFNEGRYTWFKSIVPPYLQGELFNQITSREHNLGSKLPKRPANDTCAPPSINHTYLPPLVERLKLLYDPKIKQFNLHKSDHNGEPYDGGTSSKTRTNKGAHTDIIKGKREMNIKVNLDDKNIVMSEENGQLVEVDLYSQNVKLINTGYKYGITNGIQTIIELGIPDDAAIVSSASKNRTNMCTVKRIYDPSNNKDYTEAYGKYYSEFKYTVGKNIIIGDFIDSSLVCCSGIHFCHSIKELANQQW